MSCRPRAPQPCITYMDAHKKKCYVRERLTPPPFPRVRVFNGIDLETVYLQIRGKLLVRNAEVRRAHPPVHPKALYTATQVCAQEKRQRRKNQRSTAHPCVNIWQSRSSQPGHWTKGTSTASIHTAALTYGSLVAYT